MQTNSQESMARLCAYQNLMSGLKIPARQTKLILSHEEHTSCRSRRPGVEGTDEIV